MTLILVLGAGNAFACTCGVIGHVTAEATDDPDLPTWKYTFYATWCLNFPEGIGHLDLLIDSTAGTCSCEDVARSITLADPVGSSEREGGCSVPWDGALQCEGDLSVPADWRILLRFVPQDGDCTADQTDVGIFEFYSDQPPVAFDSEDLVLVDATGNYDCTGRVNGVFPGLACDPVADEGVSWGSIKGLYR